MGIPVEGGKIRDPRQKRSEGVDDDTQPGDFHAVYLLPFRVHFGLSFFSCYISCPNQKASSPVKKLTMMNKYFFLAF
jgi:hypothetical protein